jgi:threonine/homoserine/homoserine lactone efflux protein
MPDLATLALFAAASAALIVVPGPSVIYIVARSVDQGRSAGLVSAFGVRLGDGPAGSAAGASSP